MYIVHGYIINVQVQQKCVNIYTMQLGYILNVQAQHKKFRYFPNFNGKSIFITVSYRHCNCNADIDGLACSCYPE